MGLASSDRKSDAKLTVRLALSKQFLRRIVCVKILTQAHSSTSSLFRSDITMITIITIKSTAPIPIPTVNGVNGPQYFGAGVGVGVGGGGGGGGGAI